MPVTQPQVSIALPLRPKSYILTVEYKGGWPSFISYDYHYHKLEELMKHVEWIASQMKGQNGKSAKRRNVVTSLLMRERLRSKRVDKELPSDRTLRASQGPREACRGQTLRQSSSIDESDEQGKPHQMFGAAFCYSYSGCSFSSASGVPA
jgi:hypothetical protein